jgi:DNA-binding transcriptional LysR family regulator
MVDFASSELNLRELRVLSALLHERSITRTAELLTTTQPGVSKILRHLRAQFADPLFVRNGHAMQPTAKALEIAETLRALLGAADSLRASASAFDPVHSDRTFSLLLTDVGMIHFLPPVIARVAAIAPKVKIRATPLDARQFELKLEAGEADLALGAFPKAARHLRRQRLYFDSFVTVARKGHPRLSASRSRAGFVAQRHILAKRLAEPLGLVTFETPVALPRIEISQYWHERYHRDAAHRWFRSVTSDLFGTTTRTRS